MPKDPSYLQCLNCYKFLKRYNIKYSFLHNHRFRWQMACDRKRDLWALTRNPIP